MPRASLSTTLKPTSSGLSAAGSTQGTATAITVSVANFSTVGANQGGILPASTPGVEIFVSNRGANPLSIYPPTSSAIDALGTNNPFVVPINTTQSFCCINSTTWVSNTIINAARVQSITSSATITPTASNDLVVITALAVAPTFAAPTGTYTDGFGYVIQINGVATARALTWNAAYQGIGAALPTTTVSNKTMVIPVYYSTSLAKHLVMPALNQP